MVTDKHERAHLVRATCFPPIVFQRMHFCIEVWQRVSEKTAACQKVETPPVRQADQQASTCPQTEEVM